MVQPGSATSRRGVVIALLVSTMALLTAGLGQRDAEADVTQVRGSAFNCSGNIRFFGQQQPPTPPTASVTLPPGGSANPVTATAPCTVRIQFPGGPGPVILSTGPVTVSTQGTTGPTGSVTSTATANDVGVDPNEALQAATISSTCTATESGVTGSTTVTGGTVVTDQTAGTVGPVPQNPTPGFTIEGINGAGDRYRYVFNEQSTAADGTLTVNAVHLYLLGPSAIGDVILGQVVCGVTAVAVTTTVAPSTTTTVAGQCLPGEDGAKPGYGYGDRNHRHCGPPGRTRARPVASTSDATPSWPLIAGLGLLIVIPLVVPFGRAAHRGDRRA